jgi:hypothetical protein
MKKDKGLRILVSSGCLGVVFLGLALLLAKRYGGSPTVEKERRLTRILKTPFNPATWPAQSKILDSNSIPVLTKALEEKRGIADKAYTLAWSKVPLMLRSNLPQPIDATAAEGIRIRASALLADRKVGEFVPPSTLVKELRDSSSGVRMNALACLNNAVLPKTGTAGLGEEKGTILGLVLAAAGDPEMPVRMSAVCCLGYFKEAPDQVRPILTKALTDNFSDVRIRAAMAFYRFDPAQAEKCGAISTAIDCLQSSGPHGSGHLAYEFLKKEGKLPPSEKQ